VPCASPDTLYARLHHRHIDHESGLERHLARTGELDSILDASDVAEIEIAVDALTREDVATTVLVIGWTIERAGVLAKRLIACEQSQLVSR
jgi:hypothetical protein